MGWPSQEQQHLKVVIEQFRQRSLSFQGRRVLGSGIKLSSPGGSPHDRIAHEQDAAVGRRSWRIQLERNADRDSLEAILRVARLRLAGR